MHVCSVCMFTLVPEEGIRLHHRLLKVTMCLPGIEIMVSESQNVFSSILYRTGNKTITGCRRKKEPGRERAEGEEKKGQD